MRRLAKLHGVEADGGLVFEFDYTDGEGPCVRLRLEPVQSGFRVLLPHRYGSDEHDEVVGTIGDLLSRVAQRLEPEEFWQWKSP